MSKGNSVPIGNYVVPQAKEAILFTISKEKEQIAHTFSKTAPVAIAKKCAEGNKSIINEVMKLDLEIEKNYNDAMFFQHSFKATDDELRKEVLECRLDIATSKIDQGRSRLEDYIYN